MSEEDGSCLLQRRLRKALKVSTKGGASGLVGALLAAAQRKNIIPLEEGEKIFDRYHWDEVLQETGDGGKVVICQPKYARETDDEVWSPRMGCHYVMKIRSKESLENDGMSEQFRKSQIQLLNMPPNQGVLPIHEVLEDDKFFYIVMQKATGGSFFPVLLSEFGDGVMPERAVRKVIREILEAVGYIHSQGMLHRDIKPDNLVFQVKGDDPASPSGKNYKVAVIDFDHADPDWDPRSPSQSQSWCGTLRFSAPETFCGHFSQASDLYSIGVILYMLMAGGMPYDDVMFEEVIERKTPGRFNWRAAIHQRMEEARVDWSAETWESHPACTDFCKRMLAFNAEDRIQSASQALAHEWFSQ